MIDITLQQVTGALLTGVTASIPLIIARLGQRAYDKENE